MAPYYPVDVFAPPSGEPVTLDQLKAHLRHQLGTAEDDILADYLAAARQRFEFETSRAVLPTTYTQHAPDLSAPIPLQRGKVTAVNAVRYYDAAGTLQTLDPAAWWADLFGSPARVTLAPGVAPPAVQAGRPFPVAVEFVAGWANAAAVPAAVKVGIRQLAGHLYRHRETLVDAPLSDLPFGFACVVDAHALSERRAR